MKHTKITLRRLEDTHFATIYFYGTWAGMVQIRILSIDDQTRIMNGETVIVKSLKIEGEAEIERV
jgi:hypothetical protein